MAGTVVVFDFDRTVIDDDSDRWVIEEMGLKELFNELYRTMPWNSLMDRMLMEVHSQGKTTQDVANSLRRALIHPSIAAAIKSAHAIGMKRVELADTARISQYKVHSCELRIISDANKFYIEVILEHYGLLECFSEITTNPVLTEPNGRLRILPYHGPSSPHGCNSCPSNLCKGLAIGEVVGESDSEGKRRRIIYVGDGGGDFCPTLLLSEDDHVMPRRNYPLWKLLRKHGERVKAKIHDWGDGDELNKILMALINTA